MFPILVTLGVALFVVVIIAVFAVASVLAQDESTVSQRNQQWNPPLAAGSTLSNWVRDIGRMIVAD